MVIQNPEVSKALDYVWIVNIVDRSGSMRGIHTDMQGAIEQFLDGQAEQPGRCTIGLAQFDDKYEVVYSGVNILKRPDYVLVPRGGTALLDAIGNTITNTEEQYLKLPSSERPDKVFFVITTDGYENSSKEWTKKKIADLINDIEKNFGWQVIYLGANQDAIQEGDSFGVSKTSGITYVQTPFGISSVYSSLSSNISSVRAGNNFNVAFTDADRETAVGKTSN